MAKKVSIVIPCYNSERFINDTVTSAFEQTYPISEVICVDNNSTDGTMSRLRDLQDRYPSLIVSKETKQNACAARNKGMSLSTGDWIQFLDSDDVLLPEKISNQMKEIEETEDDPDFLVGTYIRRHLAKNEDEIIKAFYDPWKAILFNRLGQTTTNLFKRKAIEDIGGWNDDLKSSQEYDLMFRLLQNNDNIARCNEADTVVQVRDGSINTGDVLGNQHRYLHLMARIIDYLKTSRTDIYEKIDDDFFQKMFVRIRLSAINGYPDYAYFYDKIMPSNMALADNKFTPKWFSRMTKVVGYKNTENFRQLIKGRRQ